MEVPRHEAQLSRRRLLGAAAAGAAGLASAFCGGKKASTGSGPTLAALPTGTSQAPSTTATRAPASGKHGESLRVSGYVTRDKSADPHRTQAGPFYGQQALVFSRLLAYQSQVDGSIVADLAQALPEQPDATTFVFRLNPAAKWHERAPVNGRAVTANDVRVSIERQRTGDASFVRKARWLAIDSLEATDPGTLVVKLKEPIANMPGTFAEVNAFIVPEELAGIDIGLDAQIGSGPFRWVEWNDNKFGSVARNPAWHGGNQRPYLDGITVVQPKDTAEIEAGLRTWKFDAVYVGRPQAERLKRAVKELQESTIGQSLFYGMRFFEPQAPYNDPRFRGAVSIALDRRAMVAEFFAGSGDVNPWVSWPMTRWSLPQTELMQQPGYRAGSGGRDQDLAEAKALLDAFKAEKSIPDQLALFVPDDVETNLGMGQLIQAQLKASLGLNVVVAPMAIGQLVEWMLDGRAPWVAGPDNGWIDLDDWVYPYFQSAGTKNSFPLRSSEMDGLITAQRAELDEAKRREIGYAIQRKLLALNLGLNFVSEKVVALAWPYVRNFPVDAADGYQHRFADTWIDREDPSFRGR